MRGLGEARIRVHLIDAGEIRLQRLLADTTLAAEMRKVHHDSPLRRRQEGARAKVVLRRQRLRAEVLEASLLAIVGDLRSESPPVR